MSKDFVTLTALSVISLLALALAAASQRTPKVCAQADAFNAVFGVRTNLSIITPPGSGGISAGPPLTPALSFPATSIPPYTPAPPSGAANFGTCSTPEIKFAVGLDGRKETAFAPIDPVSYGHGSADDIDVITSFMYDALANNRGANQAAEDLFVQAEAAANAATPLTGAQTDAFNGVFGQTTNFASVTPVDDTGNPVQTL
ncbi:hypothetical protein BJV78DRAFT_1285085 [Lactifluus subvellereus]|nr:hypothetical protein BJV78DRAFT_1285085 [Lactifluus subvellereus]